MTSADEKYYKHLEQVLSSIGNYLITQDIPLETVALAFESAISTIDSEQWCLKNDINISRTVKLVLSRQVIKALLFPMKKYSDTEPAPPGDFTAPTYPPPYQSSNVN